MTVCCLGWLSLVVVSCPLSLGWVTTDTTLVGGPSPHDGSARPQRLPPPGDGGSGGHGQGSQDDSSGWKREGSEIVK